MGSIKQGLTLSISAAVVALGGQALAQEGAPPVPAGEAADPQVAETHVVEGGDTLWDLCGKYLNSPWYWPKIWSYNPQLTNPHWIFPGNEIRFYPSDEGPSQIEVNRDLSLEGPEVVEEDVPQLLEPEDLVRPTGAIEVGRVTAGSVVKVHTGFVAQGQIARDGLIVNSIEESQLLVDGQTAYVKFNSAVKKGETYAAYRKVKPIEHPITGELVGFVVEIVGQVRVVDTSPKVATVMIERAYRPVERGDVIGQVPEGFGRRVEPSPNQQNLKGYIVESMEGALTSVGEHHVVFIDRGSSQGVQIGNQFDVYHRGDGFTAPRADLPNEVVGKVMVIDVQENTSTALVLKSMRDLGVGDKVEMNKT